LNYKKPPLTLGTALWFRTNAIRGLYKVHWDYSDFDDEKLGVSGNYLSYGIERIFPYVAQDAGYDTGEVMTLEYAQLQNSYLHYSVPRLINYASMYYNIPTTIADLEIKQKQVDRLLKFSNRYESVFLYGAGKRGQYCLRLLRKNGIEKEKAFIVSYRPNNEIVEGLRVISVNSVNKCEVLSSGIIITVADKDAQKDIIRNLGELGITNYMIF
jgi:rhamnosyltransferase